MSGLQLTIAIAVGVVAILVATGLLHAVGFTAAGVAAGSLATVIQSIFYGARVASGSLFAILQSAGAVVFGWPKQLAIALIFGYLAWVYLRPSIRLFQFFSARVAGFSWPIQLAIALIFGCLAWVSLRQSMLYRLLQFFTAGAVGFSWPKQLGIALIVGCLAWVFLRP